MKIASAIFIRVWQRRTVEKDHGGVWNRISDFHPGVAEVDGGEGSWGGFGIASAIFIRVWQRLTVEKDHGGGVWNRISDFHSGVAEEDGGEGSWGGLESRQRFSSIKTHQSSVWTTRPERSFGSNQVDFGGMIPPASAISITVPTPTGCIENATAYPPFLTMASRSAIGRAPPR